MTGKIVEIRCGTTDLFGIGAIKGIAGILELYRKRGTKRVAVVTGKGSYLKSGAWVVVEDALKGLGYEFIHFDGITSNPTVDSIDEAVEVTGRIDPELVIAIGGGSPIDSSKVISLLLKDRTVRARDIYRGKYTPWNALPVIAVNLSHGTGSEVDRYAVATVPEDRKKAGFASDLLYPAHAIDDPQLTLSLPGEEVLYTSLDALNHLIEAATTTKTSPYTVMLAREGTGMIARWLPVALEEGEDLEARYWLMYASILGGIAIDCSVVHITHPLEHTLSAFNPHLQHGLGLAILLPSVIRTIYPAVPDVLDQILHPITSGQKGAVQVSKTVEDWLISLGINKRLRDLGFDEHDIGDLAENVMSSQREGGSLSLSPLKVDREVIERIYRESL